MLHILYLYSNNAKAGFFKHCRHSLWIKNIIAVKVKRLLNYWESNIRDFCFCGFCEEVHPEKKDLELWIRFVMICITEPVDQSEISDRGFQIPGNSKDNGYCDNKSWHRYIGFHIYLQHDLCDLQHQVYIISFISMDHMSEGNVRVLQLAQPTCLFVC